MVLGVEPTVSFASIDYAFGGLGEFDQPCEASALGQHAMYELGMSNKENIIIIKDALCNMQLHSLSFYMYVHVKVLQFVKRKKVETK